MYRLGVSYIDNSSARDTDAELRNSFLNPATPIIRQPDHAVGGSIYDPAYYSSLFEESRDGVCSSHSKLAILPHEAHKISTLPRR